MNNKVIFTLFLFLLLSSCSVHKTVTNPDPKLNLIDNEKKLQENFQLNSKWWESFNDKELNKTIELLFTKNLTLKQSIARLKQMESVAKIAGAGMFPSVNVAIDGQSTKYSDTTINFLDGTQTDKINLYNMTGSLSYQLDLWKKISNGKKAELYSYLATEKGVESTYMTVVSTTIDLWYSIAEQKKAVKLIKNQVSALEEYLNLLNMRAAKGLATLLEVLQQKQLVESTKNKIPMEELKLNILKNQLSVLLGENPADFKFDKNIIIPSIDNIPNTGLPSQLLKNRPDVKAAEYNLIASDHRLAVAIADRFPSINLGISFGSQMDSPSKLFDSWFLKLSGNLLGPIIDGGRRKNEVKRNREVVYEKFSTWQLSILNAIKEVEDTVFTEKKYKETLKNTTLQVSLGTETLKQSTNRYINGLTDYLNVLSAQKTLLQLQREKLRIKRELVSNRAKLYLAIGGDFSEKIKKEKHNNIKLEEKK